MAAKFNGFTRGDFLSCNGTKAGAERLVRRMRELAGVLAPRVARLNERLVPVVSPPYTDRNFKPNRNRPRDHACLIFVDRNQKRSRFPRLPQLGVYLHADSLSIGLCSGWWAGGRLRQLLRSAPRRLRPLSRYSFFPGDIVIRPPRERLTWRSDLLDRVNRTFFVGEVYLPEADGITPPEVVEVAVRVFTSLLPIYDLLMEGRPSRTPAPEGMVQEVPEEPPAPPDKAEAALLQDLHKFLKNRFFDIELSALLNIYLSAKAKPFVLLSGISGTGKSLLVRLLAEGVNGVRDGLPVGYRLIPVRPGWQDCRDLMGFPNLLTGRFEMGDLLRAFQEARALSDRPYFVCLDEMNLSRVEHYFSDILSIMETGRRFPDGAWGTDPISLSPRTESLLPSEDNAEPLPSRQPIPDNLFIFGTVNVDESTYPFSRKVLDRANTVEFTSVDLRLLPDPSDAPPLDIDILRHLGPFLFHRPYRKLSDFREGHPALRWNDPLIQINALLQEEDLHFGYRVRDEILSYMAYAIDLIESLPGPHPPFDEETAFDFQVLQKILPRLSGSDEVLGAPLTRLLEYCRGRFPRSEKKLTTMARRLERTGFTHFWAG